MNKILFAVALLSIGVPVSFAQKAPVTKVPPKVTHAAPVRTTWPLEAANTVGSYLLARKDVQADLKVPANAASKIDEICASIKREIAEIKAQGKPAKGEHRKTAREVYEQANKGLHELLDQSHYTRLRAINLQDMSFNAYFYPDVQDELGMNDSERGQLKSIEAQLAAKIKQINEEFKAGKITKDQRKTELGAAVKDARQQVLALVPKEQQAKLEQIEAPKFKFTKA